MSGVIFILKRPQELPRSLLLTVRLLWNLGFRRKKLLVLVRHGGLGDVVCFIASIPGMRKRHPDAWLIAVTPPGCARLVQLSGLPDAAVEHGSFFHEVVSRICDPSRYYRPILPDEHEPRRPNVRHLAEEFAHAMGVMPDPLAVHFRIPWTVRRRIARRLQAVNPDCRPVLVLHPGPTWPVREWPASHWNELAELVAARTGAVMIRIGSVHSLGNRRPSGSIPHAVDWANTLDIVETTALIEKAAVFVGVDSGPLHLAGALDVPSVGLFGAVFGQLRVHPGGSTTVVAADLPCIGCHHHPDGPQHWLTGCPHDIRCMSDLTPERVFSHLVNHLMTRSVAAGAPAA